MSLILSTGIWKTATRFHENIDVSRRSRDAVIGDGVGAHDDELDACVGKFQEQIPEVLVQITKRHGRPEGRNPEGTLTGASG